MDGDGIATINLLDNDCSAPDPPQEKGGWWLTNDKSQEIMGPTVTDIGSTGRQSDPSYQSNQVSVPNMDDTFGCKSGPNISCDICQYIPSGKEDSVEHVLWAHETVKASGWPNFMVSRIPVKSQWNIDFMDSMLTEYHDSQVTTFLKYGWPINVDYSKCPLNTGNIPPNHRGANDHKVEVAQYLSTEISAGSAIGPFYSPPFSSGAAFSPLNTRDKKGSQEKRVIVNLSYPPGCGVNDFIDLEDYFGTPMDLRYPSVETLLQKVREKGRGCLLYKRDLKRCYRFIPVDYRDINYLGYTVDGHMFFDTSLPMGLSSSAYICQRTTNAIRYIANNKYELDTANYLDDMGGVAFAHLGWHDFNTLGTVLRLCGAEENETKKYPPNTHMDWVGVLIDTLEFSVAVTPEKLVSTAALLSEWQSKATATRRELQSLIGTLNFLASCVPFSRTFMTRLLDQLREVQRKSRFTVSEWMLADVSWWALALQQFNGKSFCPLQFWEAPDTTVACDATPVACGGLSGDHYFHIKFPASVMATATHISAKEILAVVVTLKVFINTVQYKRLQVKCDNMATVMAINAGRTKDRFMNACLREIAYLAIMHDFDVKAVHVPTTLNTFPDLLSRWYSSQGARRKFFELPNHPKLQMTVSDKIFKNVCSW